MTASEVHPDDAKSVCAAPDAPDSPFSPPYRTDVCIEHVHVSLPPHRRMALEANVQSLHQEALAKLVRQVHTCPQPIPALLAPRCAPCTTEALRSERIHAVLQLLAQIRENHHQAQLRKAYATYGADRRRAAKALYAREQFPVAYTQYWALYTCLSCDTCRRLPAPERHALAVDLLEKLAVTCLRAGWLADGENFAQEALAREPRSTRARIWLATAQLGQAKLPAARTNLALLPRRGLFPQGFPRWIEARVAAQRELLARLEQEARGVFDTRALEEDAPDVTPTTPHSPALFQLEATPAGYRTIARVARGALLLVAAPLVCAPCYTAAPPPPLAQKREAHVEAPAPGALPQILHDDDPESLFSLALVADTVFEQARLHSSDPTDPAAAPDADPYPAPEPTPPPQTLHDEDPPLLTLAQLADALYTQARVLPRVRVPVRAAAARCRKEGERVIDVVGNELRAAAILVAQTYALSIPHVHAGPGGKGGAKYEMPVPAPAHAGHALYLPALALLAAPSPAAANTHATFHGPHLFLRARTDLRAGTLLTFGGFPGVVRPPPISTPGASRARVTALASAGPPPPSPSGPASASPARRMSALVPPPSASSTSKSGSKSGWESAGWWARAGAVPSSSASAV